MFFGKMNRRKKQLLQKLFTATKDHLTIVRNIENLFDWMDRADYSAYQHVRHGTFLIPRVDRILDRNLMLQSALKSPNSVRVVETEAMSHFVTLDNTKWVPPLDTIPTGHITPIMKAKPEKKGKQRAVAALA